MTVSVRRPAELLRAAHAGGYALAAFNAVNLETAQAIVRAAEATHAPVVLQISENAARYGGLDQLAAIGRSLREGASVPVLLHFDHAETAESAWRALALGFDGVMLEGDDPATLRPLAEAAHARGAVLEAEYEVVAKGTRESSLADPARLAAFAHASGCDLLAVNIGTRHKQTEKTARLDFQRLSDIAGHTPLPLVLHGSSGVPEGELRRAVAGGVSKVNVATELSRAFTQGLRARLADSEDPRVYLASARDGMQARAEAIIRLLGSAGRA